MRCCTNKAEFLDTESEQIKLHGQVIELQLPVHCVLDDAADKYHLRAVSCLPAEKGGGDEEKKNN